MSPFKYIFLLWAVIQNQVLAGNILFFMPWVPKSGRITWMPIAERLAARNHNVTIISPYPSGKNIPNIEDIGVQNDIISPMIADFSSTLLKGNITDFEIKKASMAFQPKVFEYFRLLLGNDTEVAKVIHSDERHYDAVVIMGIVGNELGYYIARRKFNASMIVYFAQQSSLPSQNWAVGSPWHPAYMPLSIAGISDSHPMSFLTRVQNTFTYAIMLAMRDFWLMPIWEEMVDEYFPKDSRPHRPSLLELEREAGLALQFGNPLIADGMRPVSPNYVMIGMMNCRKANPLPDWLNNFMEDAEDGVIFVSFGSAIKSSQMSEKLKNIFTSVFSKLKQKILWKWETEEMEGKPDNVKLSKWLPQQDILSHPNLKLFISHMGQSSAQEALCHQVPVVGIPINMDQPGNSLEAERRGYGIHVPITEITEEKLSNAINKILTDKNYKRRAQEHGSLVMDEMTSPLDRAVWWMEYAMRYPGMQHMRSPVNDLHWTQFFLLDVIAFLILISVVILTILYFCCRCICRKCCCRVPQKSKTE